MDLSPLICSFDLLETNPKRKEGLWIIQIKSRDLPLSWGFHFAYNVLKAADQQVDLKKLVAMLEEIAERKTTIAITPTDHLLTMEKMQGKPLTAC